MKTDSRENLILLDQLAFNEQELTGNWESVMPTQIAELYTPLSCIETGELRIRFMAEHIVTGKKAVIVCSKGHQKEILRAEADVMDIVVLDCIPKKIAYFESENTAILVREYLNGESINGRVNRAGCFEEEAARNLGRGLCELVSKLYERNLSVETESLQAANIILNPDSDMKFVEPEGIRYCADVSENWLATERALGRIMKFMLVGENESIPERSISPEFAKVIEKCTGDSADSYKNVESLIQALEETKPEYLKRKKLAKYVMIVLAIILLCMLTMPFILRLLNP